MELDLFKLRHQIVFSKEPAHFHSDCELLRETIEKAFEKCRDASKAEVRSLLAEVTIDLGSYLPRWRLLTSTGGVDESITDREIELNCAALTRMGGSEEVQNVRREIASIRQSNLMKLSRITDSGQLKTRWGNDSAVELSRAIRRGATLVTTNPVMINDVRKRDVKTWDEVKRKTWAAHPHASASEIASFITMEVVLRNCREMRPIYEATEGKYGFVSLEVNPKNCTDSNEMAEEAEMLYAELSKELGGPANTTFKVPATLAGMKTAERLTGEGISVNVTASASVSQIIRFAEIIEQGRAPVAFLTMMSGRFEDPIRDELLKNGVPGATEAARWAGVAVARKAYEILYHDRGYKKSTLLIASIRGPWAIDGCITDGPSEVVISVFPDKAQLYDSEPRELKSHMKDPVPAETLEILSRSETFRKGYGISSLRPEEFDGFLPVSATLKQFVANYEEFLVFIQQR